MTGIPEMIAIVPVLPSDVRNQLTAIEESQIPFEIVGLGLLHHYGLLGKCIQRGNLLLPWDCIKKLRNYWVSELPCERLHSLYWPVIRTKIENRLGIGISRVLASDRMSRTLDLHALGKIRESTRLILGREDACIESFERAHRLGIEKLYDLPAPHVATVKKLMDVEMETFPNSSLEIDSITDYAPERLERKNRELQLADTILVASQMTEKSATAAGASPQKIVRIPYGCAPSQQLDLMGKKRKPVILYVGAVSLRKGIPRLLRVWKKLKASSHFQLRLIGKMSLSPNFLKQYEGDYEHIPAVPHSELAQHYSEAYAFVFPTVADGFGLVLNEALSHGLPVVASTNNGAAGFIENGRQGRIFEHGNDDQFAAELDWTLSNPHAVKEMADEALLLAKKWTWQDYRRAYANLILSRLALSKVPKN